MAELKRRVRKSIYTGRHAGVPLEERVRLSCRVVASFGRRVQVYVAVAERALGKKLPRGAVVHHVDRDRTNNAADNLVICQDTAYHALLHRRIRAMEETGNPDALLCQVCSSYENQWDIRDYEAGRGQRFRIHGACMKIRNAANKKRRKKLRDEAMAAHGLYLDGNQWRPMPDIPNAA